LAGEHARRRALSPPAARAALRDRGRGSSRPARSSPGDEQHDVEAAQYRKILSLFHDGDPAALTNTGAELRHGAAPSDDALESELCDVAKIGDHRRTLRPISAAESAGDHAPSAVDFGVRAGFVRERARAASTSARTIARSSPTEIVTTASS